MQILYISYDGMTDPLGQSQVLPYLIGLSQSGYQVTLISCEKKDRFDKHQESIKQICLAGKIDWNPVSYTKSPPVLSTLYDLKQIRRLAKKLHHKKDFKLIHCRSYLSALIGLELKQKYKVPFVFDMRGFWADERLDGNIWTLENPVYKKVYQYFKKKEIEFFSKADYTISLTEAGKREIHTWELPHQPIPIQVIPCCADLEVFDYQKTEEQEVVNLRTQLGLTTSDFVLGYLGSIGTWYCLTEMMQFFQQLLIEKTNAKFLFVSKEDPTAIYLEAKKFNVPKESIVIRSANRLEVANYLALMDCGIFFIKPVFSKTASSPTKQAEMMAMGLPLICNDIGDTGTIVEENKVGISVKDFSKESFAQAIEEIPNLRSIPKQKIRQVAIDYFALTKGVEKYKSVYEQVLQKEMTHA